MPTPVAYLLLSALLTIATPLLAEHQTTADAPPEAPEAAPVEVPQTAQAWVERVRALTGDMAPSDVVTAIGRQPDYVSEKQRNRFRWGYYYTDEDGRSRSMYIFYHNNRFSHW